MSETFRDTLYTIDTRGNRNWVYATIFKGRFRNRRTLVIIILMAIYLLMPWIVINGEQAIFLDIEHRKFTFFGVTLWATETYFLLLIFGGLAFSLFFFTSLFGRIWCGWACPTTVFLEFLYRPIEQWIEGGPVERKRLDQSPWNLRKIVVKSKKQFIFLMLAWILASTALAYFVGRERLLQMMTKPPSDNFGLFLGTLFLTGIAFFQFSWFREQFCTVLCPYARFQSVLLDRDSLVIGYDKKRGEPRGKSKDEKNGDCVDCGLCVRVCPTGIDIRNGLQLECIQCASCIDACDSVMDKLGRKEGLVRYSTERSLLDNVFKIIRPRVFVYGTIITVYAIIFITLITTRKLSEFQLIRAVREMPFSINQDGSVMNHMKVHIANKSKTLDSYSLNVKERDDIVITVPLSPFPVNPESLGELPIFFTFKREILQNGKLPIIVEIKSKNGFKSAQKITMLGPG